MMDRFIPMFFIFVVAFHFGSKTVTFRFSFAFAFHLPFVRFAEGHGIVKMSGGMSDLENNLSGVVDISNTIDEASHDIESSSSDPEDTTGFYEAMYHKSLSCDGAVDTF